MLELSFPEILWSRVAGRDHPAGQTGSRKLPGTGRALLADLYKSGRADTCNQVKKRNPAQHRGKQSEPFGQLAETVGLELKWPLVLGAGLLGYTETGVAG